MDVEEYSWKSKAKDFEQLMEELIQKGREIKTISIADTALANKGF